MFVAGVLSIGYIKLYDTGIGWYTWDTLYNWYGYERDDVIVFNIVMDIIMPAIATIWFDNKFKD
jgi:hypothetical protein